MMMNKGKHNLTMIIVGATVMLTIVAISPIISMVFEKPSFNLVEIDTSQRALSPFKTYTSPMGSGAVGWYPKLLVGPDGYGYAAWVAETPQIFFTNGTHAYPFNGSGSYFTHNVTITIRKTTGSLSATGGVASWNTTMVKTLANVFQRKFCSFMDAAFNKNGELIVFFSNQTFTNGSAASLSTFSAMLWNSNTGLVTEVNASTQNWKHAMADLDLSQSLSSRGASGQILFRGNDMHLLWNNGTHVFYRFNQTVSPPLASATYMGECSMAMNEAGTLWVVYSKGASISSKEVFMRSKPAGGSFSSETQKTSAGKECIDASVFLNAAGNPHVVWSSQDDDANYNRYVIKYNDGTTTRSVSTDRGNLPFINATLTRKVYTWQPRGIFLNGILNIFYVDSTEYTSVGGGSSNIAWQCYDGSSFADNTLRILSNRDLIDDLSVSIVPIEDDIFVVFYSETGSLKRINFSKVDYTMPTVVLTSPTDLDKPISYDITFTVSESDLATLIVQWDGRNLAINATDRSVMVPANGIAFGPHSYSISVIDEVGNQALISGTVNFRGIPVETLITIIIIAAAAVVVILVGVWYSKNKAKIMKRKLGLKLQAKASEGEWDEETPVEEDTSSASDSGDIDLKNDLKKVDK
ncbi:MAG: hypothetical protein Q6373_003850 [Candidatus Sigynarchaeota archaeon]